MGVMDMLKEIEELVAKAEAQPGKYIVPTRDVRYLLDLIHGHEEAEESLQKEIKRLDKRVRDLEESKDNYWSRLRDDLQEEIVRLERERDTALDAAKLLRQDLVRIERDRDDAWDAANKAREMASADSSRAVSVVADLQAEVKRLRDALEHFASDGYAGKRAREALGEE